MSSRLLRTNVVKARIEKQNVSATCRMCGNHEETVRDIFCSCSKLAQVEHKKRHDTLGKVVRGELCRKYCIDCSDKWYEHVPRKVEENEEVKILWDFNIEKFIIGDQILSSKERRGRRLLWTLLSLVTACNVVQ